MNCKDWEERIAMSASGDLSPEPRAEVERHLAECGECRGFAQGIEDSLALLRSAHEEAIAAGHYAAVRARVQDRMARERRSAWRRWVWAPAFVAAGLALVGVFLTKRPGERPKVYVAEVRPRAVQRRPRIRRRVAPEPQPPVEPLVIKLITDDPNVVIYWFADGKGEAQ